MRVEYETTVDDFVALQRLARSQTAPPIRRMQQLNAVGGAALGGLLLYLLIPDTPTVKLVFAAFGVIVGLPLAFKMQSGMQQNLERRLAEHALADRSSTRVVVELEDDGVLVDQGDLEILLRWRGLKAIEEDADRIAIRGPIGVVGVPLRAFKSPQQAQEFLAEIKRRMPQIAG